jgi:peroxiredoxin
MPIRIGDKAPEFALYSSEKQLVRLSDFRGRNVVLLFFPLAFTGTCTKELCSTRDDMETYNHLNTEVLGISIDTLQSLARYKQDYQFNFTLLSDFNKETVRAYDVMYEEFGHNMRGVGKRAVFVIDGEGIVRHLEVLENAGNLPDFEQVQLALRKLQAVTGNA